MEQGAIAGRKGRGAFVPLKTYTAPTICSVVQAQRLFFLSDHPKEAHGSQPCSVCFPVVIENSWIWRSGGTQNLFAASVFQCEICKRL